MKADKKDILKKLSDSINPCLTKDLPIPDVIRYLINLEGEDDEKSPQELSDSAAHKIYNGQSSSLNKKHAVLLSKSTNWTLERLYRQTGSEIDIDFKMLKQNISCIYNKYFPDSKTDCNISVMIKSLISLYFFDTDDIELIFDIYQKSPCQNYVVWEEKYQELKTTLISNNIVFVTGNPGSGKSQLVKYYIKENSNKFKDIGWVEGDYFTFEQCLINIPFLCITVPLSLDEVKELLSYKSENALLIIDLPAFTNDDLFLIDEIAATTKLKIIITTRNHESISTYKYPAINLNNWPDKLLKKIFIKTYKTNFFTNDEYKKFFKIISRNPLIIVLIGKGLQQRDKLKNGPATTLKILNICKIDLLDEKEWIWNNVNLPKIGSKAYTTSYSKQLIPKQIKYILSKYDPHFLKNTGARLCIWAKSEVDYNFLFRYFYPDSLTTALNIGLLEYCDDDKTTVKMPAIISDTIWNEYPIPFRDYKSAITKYITHMDDNNLYSISPKMKYSILFNLIYRFHFQIITLKSTADKNHESDIKDWFNLLVQAIQQLIDMGNIRIACDLANQLYITRRRNKDIIVNDSIFEKTLKDILTDFCTFIENPNNKKVDINIPIHMCTDDELSALTQITMFVFLNKCLYQSRIEQLEIVFKVIDKKPITKSPITDYFLYNLDAFYQCYAKSFSYTIPSIQYTELLKNYFESFYCQDSENRFSFLYNARNILAYMLNHFTLSSPWTYRALLSSYFFELVLINFCSPLDQAYFSYNKDFIFEHFNTLTKYYKKFSAYWDIRYTYNIITLLFNPYPLPKQAREFHLNAFFADLSNLANEQIVLTDAFRNNVLKTIDTTQEKMRRRFKDS